MRFQKLDILRWLAILLMIIFHINYSLLNIYWIKFLNFSEIFWFIIWKISVLLFITISWISFFLAEKKYSSKKDNKKSISKKYFKYSLFLWFISLVITFWTYFILRSQTILFWIIHFFSISYLLILFFRRFKYFNIIIWLIIILIPFFVSMKTNSHYLFFLWFLYPWFNSSDFYPIFPYFGIFLISYWISIFLDKKWFLEKIFWWQNNWMISTSLEYIWKRSLLVYLIHQPIIILIIYLILLK